MNQPKILVAIRKRPLSKKQQSKGESDIISVKNRQTVIVSEYKQKVDLTKFIEETVFNFDFAFNQETTNQQIYQQAIRPLVDSAFQGAKVTCFAYGQTGSGKTFTMNGNQKLNVLGLYTLGATDIFSYLSTQRFRHLIAKISFFEIYCGKLFDLLNKRMQLTLREDNRQNINIIGLEQIHIDTLHKFEELLLYGSTQRITSQNSANAQSSRSHAILQITLKEGKKIYGKISFIDLAGNQRGADHTDMIKQTRIDGAEINKSLLSLKQCIRALDQGKGHTPFRGSKLTMVLKDSFVGFCRTIMIGNISPSSASSENTLNTLRYADRVKQLRKPSQGLTKQQLKARQMMLPRQNNNAIKIDITKDDDAEDIEEKRRQAQRNYGIRQQIPIINHKQQQKQQTNKKPIQIKKTRNQQSMGSSSPLSRPTAPILKQSMDIAPLIKTVSQTQTQTQQQQQQPSSANQHKSQSVSSTAKFQMKNVNNQKYLGINNDKILHPKYGVIPQYKQNLNKIHSLNSDNVIKQNMENKIDLQQSHTMYNQSAYQNNNNHIQEYNNNNTQPIHTYSQNNFYQRGPQQGYRQWDRVNQQGNSQSSQKINMNHTEYGGMLSHRLIQNKSQQGNQKVVLPDDFEGMVNFVMASNDQELKTKVHCKIHQQLLREENELIISHSDTLRNSLQCLKSQMSLIADLQNKRDVVSTRQYLQLMQESIDQKMCLLEMLREKMIQFTYKLERVEEIDQLSQNAGGHRGFEDQQLLDDIH